MEEIEIHNYSLEWPVEFKCIGRQLRESLGPVALRIDHIGSTSIIGLAAKPIIDIQISVSSLEPVDPFLKPMESLGYIWEKDNPEKTKRYFREAPGTKRTHIHIRKFGSWSEQFALLFRDYLRVHREDQIKYENTKRDLANKFRFDRMKYTDSKDSIFWEIIYRADSWACRVGWEPGSSDM